MSESAYDRLVEEWARWELCRAPELRPTPEMLRILSRRRHRLSRRIGLGVAMLAMAAGAFFLVSLEPRYDLPLHTVGIRTGKRDPDAKGSKGPRGAPRSRDVTFAQLHLRYRLRGEERVRALNLLAPAGRSIELGTGDDFAFALKPSRPAHLYVFQIDARGVLTRLFPHEAFARPANPLDPRELSHIPPSPRWYFREHPTGEERLYLVLSVEAREDWERMVSRYLAAPSSARRERIAAQLRSALDGLVESPAPGSWTRVVSILPR